MASGPIRPHAPAVLVLRVIASTVLMASIPVLIRLADGASSFVIGVVRLSIGLGLTAALIPGARDLGFLRGRREAADGPDDASPRRPVGLLLAIGVCFGIHWITYFEAIQRSSASLGILALCTYGVHVTWMGALFSDRRPTRHDWIGVLLSGIGAWVCLPSPDASHGAFVGFLLGMTSGVFYAALPLLHQRVSYVPHGPRAVSQFGVALLVLTPAIPFQSWDLPMGTWLALGALGVFCTFIAHNLWISITTEVRPATSGLLYYLTIPITMVLESIVLESPPSPTQWAGASLVLAGNAYVYLAKTRAGRARPVRG